MHRVKDKAAAAFGAMASDVTGRQLFATTNAHSIVLKALENETASKALARRLWLSFAAAGRTISTKKICWKSCKSQCDSVTFIVFWIVEY